MRTFLIFVLFIFCTISSFVEAASLKIHFLDVGEGDSILIQTPKGKTILVDAGNLISGFRVVEYLKKNNIHNLDYLIFTHPDLDHIGGAFFILQMMDVKRIYDNGEDLTRRAKSSDVYRWYEELVRNNRNFDVLQAEDNFLLDEVVFKVLWPYRPFIFSSFNPNSLVIMIEYKKFRCLLTGDLTIPAEKELLKKLKDLKADVLKVGHHGSNSSSEEFLRVVSPEISVISVNKENIRGYPAEEVLKRLEKFSSKVYRTDRDGDIIINAEDGKIWTIADTSAIMLPKGGD